LKFRSVNLGDRATLARECLSFVQILKKSGFLTT